jgi:hypothetical protein
VDLIGALARGEAPEATEMRKHLAELERSLVDTSVQSRSLRDAISHYREPLFGKFHDVLVQDLPSVLWIALMPRAGLRQALGIGCMKQARSSRVGLTFMQRGRSTPDHERHREGVESPKG